MAYAHAGRYGTDSLTRRNGRPVPAGTDVDVYEAGTTTPATLYADRDRAPASNPATVTTLGNLTFFAEPGEYDLLVGSTTLRVVATPDPRDTDAAAAVGTVTSVNGDPGPAVVLDHTDVDAVPVTAMGLLAGERNLGDWSSATAYVVGDVVHDHGGDRGVYVCTVANTNEQPSLTPAKWTAIDGTGREFAVGAGSHAGDSALSIGTGATSGDAGLSIGTQATSGVGGLSIGAQATSGDYEVNVSGIYKGTVDTVDPTIPTGASIATGFVDLPETAATSNPATDHKRLVARTDGLYVRDEAGTETGPLGAGGSGLMQSIGYTSGAIYGLLGSAASVNYHPANGAGRWVAHPIWLPAGNYAGLSVLSTVAAVATWRLGIYNGTPEGATTLLHDCGTVNMNATPGSLLASSAFTIATTGLYWVAVLVDAHTATPTVVSYRGTPSDIPALPYLGARLGAAAFTRSYFARYASSVSTGSMPGTAPTQLATDQSTLIRVHAA